jgi:hypothetical protein
MHSFTSMREPTGIRGGGGASHRDYINKTRAPMRRPPGGLGHLGVGMGGKGDEEGSHVERDLEHSAFMHQLARLHVNADFGPSP